MPAAAPLHMPPAQAGHPILAALSPADRHLLLNLATRKGISRGTTLFWEGTPPTVMGLVLDGRIKQYRTTRAGRELLVDLAGPGDAVGLLALLDDGPYAVTATAVRDADMLMWRTADVRPLLRSRPQIQAALLPWALRILRQAWDRISEMGQTGVPARLACLLLRLAREQGVPVREGMRLHLPLTHLDLAALLGTTRESVTRTISDFRRCGAMVPLENDNWLIQPELLAGFTDA